jgi:hypothetical protein
MTKNSYNGWYNYETWAVNLWLDSEEGSQNYWREAAKESLQTVRAHRESGDVLTIDERAMVNLAHRLKDEHEEALPSFTGFAADLLNAAMSEVNWREIAQHLVEAAMESEAA